MEIRGSGLFRTFFNTLENRQPQFFRLTGDRFWVADLEFRDDDGIAFALQGFDIDGNEVFHRDLHRIDPEEPVPYCRITNWAAVLLHASEDPQDRSEDKALTVRWFPYDTLTEQVWRIELSQLPGELFGIDQIWDDPDRPSLTLKGTFLQEDDVCDAYLKLDLDARRLTLLWSAASGSHKGEPDLPQPSDGPDPEDLVINKTLVDLINYRVQLDDVSVHPLEMKADNARCEVTVRLLLSDLSTRDVSFSGPHYDFFFPVYIEGSSVIIDLKVGAFLPYVDFESPVPPFDLIQGAFLRLANHRFLEVDRDFADAHLSQACRNRARYADEHFYRWWADGMFTVLYELPDFFDLDYEVLTKWLFVRSPDYLRELNIDGWNAYRERYLSNRATSKALFQKLKEDAAKARSSKE